MHPLLQLKAQIPCMSTSTKQANPRTRWASRLNFCSSFNFKFHCCNGGSKATPLCPRTMLKLQFLHILGCFHWWVSCIPLNSGSLGIFTCLPMMSTISVNIAFWLWFSCRPQFSICPCVCRATFLWYLAYWQVCSSHTCIQHLPWRCNILSERDCMPAELSHLLILLVAMK